MGTNKRLADKMTSNSHAARRLRSRRCVEQHVAPVGAENLCHQAIFVNHAPSAVAPPDAEVV
jgi:hypothetical protein